MRFEIGNAKEYRAALYIRLSKEDDKEEPESESVTNQRSLLMDFAETHALFVHDTYIDDGWSGTTFDRPAFRRMIADIEEKRVNMVVTKDLSRLGRDYIQTGHYMERYFPEHHVRYISLLDGIDSGTDSTANDITPFRAIMNDMYAKDISKKIKSVKHDKQRKGQFIGGKAVYGYRLSETEKNKIVIDEEAAGVVRRVFALAVSGESCRKIAQRLNEDGVPTPAAYARLKTGSRGKGLWSGERISDMLQNPVYIGSMAQGKSRRISYKTSKCIRTDRQDWKIVENTHEPIVERELFEKAAAQIGLRRSTRARTYDYLLKGLIRCRECGHPLAVVNRPNAAGEDTLYFICRTYQRYAKSRACTCHSAKVDDITAVVMEQVRGLCGRYLDIDALESAAVKLLEEAGGHSAEAERTRIESRLEALTAKLDRMYMDMLAGLLEETDFARLYTRAKEERAALEAKQRTLPAEIKENISVHEQATQLVERFLNAQENSRELLTSLIEKVEMTEDKQLFIHFRFCRPNPQSRLQ